DRLGRQRTLRDCSHIPGPLERIGEWGLLPPMVPGTPRFFHAMGPSPIDSEGPTECLCQVWAHSEHLNKKTSIWGTPYNSRKKSKSSKRKKLDKFNFLIITASKKKCQPTHPQTSLTAILISVFS